jgi:hypothetical protein
VVLFSHADKKGSDGDGEGSTWAQQIFAEEGFRPVNAGEDRQDLLWQRRPLGPAVRQHPLTLPHV